MHHILLLVLSIMTVCCTTVRSEIPPKTGDANPSVSEKDVITVFQTGERYWRAKKVGTITRTISEDENTLTFEFSVGGILAIGQINKNLLEDNVAKTKGAKSALQILIKRQKLTYPQQENYQELYKETIERLNSLTGLNFKYPDQWSEWYETNKESLVWSDKENRMIIENDQAE